jgi:uncharacterized protein
MPSQGFTRREFLQTVGSVTAVGSLTNIPASSMLPESQQILSPRFSWLRLGQVKPTGWIKAQLQMDLREGFAGNLDRLAPAEVATDIFGRGRNRPSKLNMPTPHGNRAPAWWNGESEGNWRTGYIMMAYLGEEPEAKQKADDYVRHILQTQDDDGYIGIYSPELRYSPNPGNAELWTQACILRGLLAYYELTSDTKVLNAVERAVACTMANYGPSKKTAFGIPKAIDGGVAHGLMFNDVIEQLHDLTGEKKYRDFGLWFYQDFCTGIPSKYQDVTLASLLNINRPFFGHAAHTYEGMRVPLWLYFVTGKSDLGKASENAFLKVKRYTFPSGGAVSMENIGAREPDPTHAFYEYCALKELLATFSSGLQKTGNAEFGDKVERLIFNAAQGARAAQGKAITYCTSDNRYQASGALFDRDKFSPTHADVAVCCVPNAAQIMSLYVRGMWMRAMREQGLCATLYGPCSVNANVRGINVRINEETHYPFSSDVSITLSPERPVEFPLLLRNPGWSENTRVTCQGVRIQQEGDYFIVHKVWQKGDQVSVSFSEPITGISASNGEVAIQRGPLVYALQIPATERIVKTYSVAGFADTFYLPAQGANWSYALKLNPSQSGDDFGLTVQLAQDANMLFPYEAVSPIRLEGDLFNANTGKLERCTLIPMGSARASLRRATFPL